MKTTNPKDFKVLLEVFIEAIHRNCLNPKEVIEWADGILDADSEPDYFFIELSLCKNNNEIISIINELLQGDVRHTSERVLFGFLYREHIKQKQPLINILTTIDWMFEDSDLTQKERNILYEIDMEYTYAASDYGKMAIVALKMNRFLEMYRDFQIHNFKNWGKIHERIDLNINYFSSY
jgi:hypothetical protein